MCLEYGYIPLSCIIIYFPFCVTVITTLQQLRSHVVSSYGVSILLPAKQHYVLLSTSKEPAPNTEDGDQKKIEAYEDSSGETV